MLAKQPLNESAIAAAIGDLDFHLGDVSLFSVDKNSLLADIGSLANELEAQLTFANRVLWNFERMR